MFANYRSVSVLWGLNSRSFQMGEHSFLTFLVVNATLTLLSLVQGKKSVPDFCAFLHNWCLKISGLPEAGEMTGLLSDDKGFCLHIERKIKMRITKPYAVFDKDRTIKINFHGLLTSFDVNGLDARCSISVIYQRPFCIMIKASWLNFDNLIKNVKR